MPPKVPALEDLSKSIKIVSLGNPLLDIIVHVDDEFLSRFGLEANAAIIGDERHTALFDEIVTSHQAKYLAGGSTQNTVRGAQSLLPPHSTVYFGCVGVDTYARTLRAAARRDGLYTIYAENRELPTGRCAVLITPNARSLVAQLGAANAYKVDHFNQPAHRPLFDAASIFYFSCFHLTSSPGSIMLMAQHVAEHADSKTLVMNLGAVFLCEFYRETMMKIVTYADIIFCNEAEAQAFAVNNHIPFESLADIGKAIAAYEKVTARPRLVVITQGHLPTLLFRHGGVEEVPIKPIDPADIKDTNGAGDAFVGGYLAGMVKGLDVMDCLQLANELAHDVLKCDGAQFKASR